MSKNVKSQPCQTRQPCPEPLFFTDFNLTRMNRIKPATVLDHYFLTALNYFEP